MRFPSEIDKVIQKIGSNDDIADLSPDDETLTVVERIDGLVRSNNQLEIMAENLTALENQLVNHREKFEESRLIRVQQESSISNISIFQQATFNEKPIEPNKILVVAATGLFVFGTLFALGLWRESRRLAGGFRKVSDVERILKIPVVSKVPFDRSVNASANGESTLVNLRSKCESAVQAIMQNKKTESKRTGSRSCRRCFEHRKRKRRKHLRQRLGRVLLTGFRFEYPAGRHRPDNEICH